MICVSEIKTFPPEAFKNELQKRVYETFYKLSIPFERVDNEPAVTMEDCIAINNALNTETSKTLFLCNRQQTVFYLFVTKGDKPFRTKDFGAALGISRVSFAPENYLAPMLGTQIGATTVFSSLLECSKNVNLVFDRDILAAADYCGTDGTTTGYLRISTADLIGKLMPYTGREYRTICV